MSKTSQASPFWSILDATEWKPCSKGDFDKAIVAGKSVKYRGYPNKKTERVAEKLEESRMAFLKDPNLPRKFRAAITNPRNVVEIQVIAVDDPQFWAKESKLPRYQE